MTPAAGALLEQKITRIGSDLSRTIGTVVTEVDEAGPVALARRLGLDKVLTSRVLRALRNKDAMAVINLSPGPEPLRRLLRAAARAGVGAELIAEAEQAVEAFDTLIRRDVGGRSALDSIISAWLPEARADFELRRKKAAFKAMSQLKGVMARAHILTFMLAPSEDGVSIDYVWLFGLTGLQRLRPGAPVHFASTRVSKQKLPLREALSLDGHPLDRTDQGLLEPFCSAPTPQLNVSGVGDTVHYALPDHGFGPESAIDIVCANLNRKARKRYDRSGHNRRTSYYAQIRTPVQTLHFDVLVHEDVYAGADPALTIYDTSVDGTADINDPARDVDRYDLLESVQNLGVGINRFRNTDLPMYARLISHVCSKTGWDGGRFRGYRCRIECPVYGSQVVLAFDVPEQARDQSSVISHQ